MAKVNIILKYSEKYLDVLVSNDLKIIWQKKKIEQNRNTFVYMEKRPLATGHLKPILEFAANM
ncbi:hypothetical protein BpHYR1_015078 [Brachionus plicatilis]|uniref:Uncharacterized protein n=1 Tax=Brachionus plicatilis TaxID=10195 RepID=A0A3M7SNR4_BRAPC|nr:hypothetical protein BpHYR1_015078 [Brachionus plicatilis]